MSICKTWLGEARPRARDDGTVKCTFHSTVLYCTWKFSACTTKCTLKPAGTYLICMMPRCARCQLSYVGAARTQHVLLANPARFYRPPAARLFTMGQPPEQAHTRPVFILPCHGAFFFWGGGLPSVPFPWVFVRVTVLHLLLCDPSSSLPCPNKSPFPSLPFSSLPGPSGRSVTSSSSSSSLHDSSRHGQDWDGMAWDRHGRDDVGN